MSHYRIGLAQFEPIPGDVESNAKRSTNLILKAVSKGADIIILPELSNTGYLYEDKSHALRVSEPVEGSKLVQSWISIAKQNNVYIVGGMNERYKNDNFNSAVLVGPEGIITVYRKVHLWDLENSFFAKGNEFPSVIQLPFAKVALQICYDLWFPEMSKKQELLGVELVCVPTNWSPTPDGSSYDKYGLFAGHHLMISNAMVNSMVFACTDRIGREKDLAFLGGSCVVDSSGKIIDDICSEKDEEVKVVEVSNYKDGHLFKENRREDLYKI